MSYQALLFCPDDKTARLVTQVLSELEFTVEPCSEPFGAVKRLMAQRFDAVVVDCDNEQNATLLFKSARNSGPNQSSLSVAMVEGQTGVAKAFRIGANLVLTKPINIEQSKGTLRVARGLLRKAETVKPAGSAPAASEKPSSVIGSGPSPTRQFVPGVAAQKPLPASFSAQMATNANAGTSTSAFDLDADAAPQPDAAEATLLEYMPDAASPTPNSSTLPVPASGGNKEYPWQPVSKPLSEPMASALRRAAESAGQSTAAAQPARTSDASRGSAKPAGNFSSGIGAATAPTREATGLKVKPLETKPAAVSTSPRETEQFPAPTSNAWGQEAKVEAPSFSSLDDDEHQKGAPAGGSNKKFLFAAVAVILVAGYFGWTKMHSSSETPAAQPVANATGGASQREAAPVMPSQSPSEVVDLGNPVAAAPAVKAPVSKPSAGVATPTTSSSEPDVVEIPVHKPIIVKSQIAKPSHAEGPSVEAVQAPAPDVVASNSGDKAISGILSAAPVNVPAPAGQKIKLSQGISQGLLVKRVAPAYPPTAKQMHIQGTVQIQANISKEGNITDVKLLSGDASLGHAAMDAVRQWKYKPYVLNGEPIEIQTQVTVIFKLP